MPPEKTLLAFDTSAAHCAAALLKGGQVVASCREDMTRGQAERLFVLLEETLSEAGISWADLDALAVGTGPGNFTGIRIGVSAARGLAMSLGVPAVGVTGFEAASTGAPSEFVSLPAPRGQAYVALGSDGAFEAPQLIDLANTGQDLHVPDNTVVTGHQADVIAQFLITEACVQGIRVEATPAMNIAERVARVAGRRLAEGAAVDQPAPLYVRPADAAPPADRPPDIIP